MKVKFYKSTLFRASAYFLTISVCLIFFMPFLYMISTALKSPQQLLTRPRDMFIIPFHPENFILIFQKYNIVGFFYNTLVVVVGCVIGSILTSTTAGYALARLRFKYRETIFILTISCMFMPLFLIILPRFIIFRNLGILNSLWPLIIPSLFGSPFCIFLSRQFFRSIPLELSEASRIDGCGEWRTYALVVMPLAKPLLATIALFMTQWRWNDFIEPLIYTQNEKLFTITMGIYLIIGLGGEEVSMHYVMSFLMISTLPVILLFLALQRFFIESVTYTGLKA